MSTLLRALRGPLTTGRLEPVIRAIPAALYMAAIFLASSVPGNEITIAFDDRVAHFLEYFVLGALLLFFVSSFRWGSSRIAGAAILVFVSLHAVADELHQSLVPHRDSSLKDWVFDMLGATTAVLVLRSLARWRENG
ncbi:MAG: VanZ family protein [Acidobacteria bacterium]|nr:VanZ family protein [Acidobacteriota bacterium]